MLLTQRVTSLAGALAKMMNSFTFTSQEYGHETITSDLAEIPNDLDLQCNC
ncbi:hypothetical protein PF005_g26304 [Phytophthora fragariae]|uniref:Uncharacterized protein n=1 Tax=Phytophthora fragariae TaxID=53985 RepID=A0A6A4BYN7_9STRA|nr:hypothetical protein PF009_g22473 [Phytophthora fragariae]KAE8984493.1 hypothetical protein PF011_g20763 [Phytophthora fragariae]KAE9074464.1 hypothetical protein PF010_g24666 [Phytophthora fragariae]KAE9090376.1 hypothetical protein PF007_g19262 [Phytophthora fragariae]KAE9098130.1 hypothetical protein PF006_g23420 [Phytophthora fragariae]